ncbi:uncharacterized protein [Henckelia pumila]|uniref:uncharacterized protein n=1 Tax=Henckelia pumila TaxID=405737 RepID=UPI003C6E7DFE
MERSMLSYTSTWTLGGGKALTCQELVFENGCASDEESLVSSQTECTEAREQEKQSIDSPLISFTGGDTGIAISKKAGMVPLQMELG